MVITYKSKTNVLSVRMVGETVHGIRKNLGEKLLQEDVLSFP